MRQILFSTLLLLVSTSAKSDEPEQVQKLRETVLKQNAEQAEKINQEFLKLQNDLDNVDPQIRARAISSICHSQDERLIPVIRALLSAPSPMTKKDAILALYRFKAKGVGVEIGKLISDPDADVRHTAAEYGSYLGYKSTLEEVQGFLQDSVPNSQSIAMHLSQTLPPEQAVAVLAPFLRHQSHHLRKRAVWALMKYDDKLILPLAVDIVKLAGDTDHWVQAAVREKEAKLQSLLTVNDLRRLSDDPSPAVREVALRMLGEKGDDVSRELAANLKSADPALREAALNGFAKQGKGPEKEIVALLDDSNDRVKSIALMAVSRLQLKSAIPKLQEIFKTGNRSDRKYAADALLKMDESLWAPAKPPTVTGPLFGEAVKLAGGEKKSWTTVLDETNALVEKLSKLKDFPCDRKKHITAKDLSQHPVATRSPGDDHTGGRLGGHTLSRQIDAVVVTHGNLAVNGYVSKSMIIVTGDLYVNDGYIYDSIVLVQGRVISDGYLNNSIVIAGRNDTLTVDDGYIWGSVAAAGTIACDGYYMKSLLGGKLTTGHRGELDMRASSRFYPQAVYDHLNGNRGKREK